MSSRRTRCILAAGLLVVGLGCGEDDPAPVVSGVFGPLGTVRPDATAAQVAAFERGREVSLRRFRPSDGLGPRFNTVFCGGCHEKPGPGGAGPRYRNFLLTGQRLQDGAFTGTGVNGVQVTYEADGRIRVPTADGTNVLATRNPIPFFGVGLLAELSDEAILVNADPDDADGDGISGRPNYDRGFVGRFGRKAQTVSIEGFIRGPLFNHLGITSNPLPDARRDELPVPSGAAAERVTAAGGPGIAVSVRGQAAAPDAPTEDDDGVPDPELSTQDLFDLVSFAMLLAAPEPEPRDEAAEAGARVFADVGCLACHVESLRGPRGRVPLYADLLLHDMGPELADGVDMNLASGAEFRTQPLWGVAATGPYLHDGRADTLHDAIVWHGGEAQRPRDAYVSLDPAAQADLLHFLESLGGRDEASDGLLAPDSPAPAVGEWGGPLADVTDLDRFEAARRLFDRDFGPGAGLGPLFNGDSCRACHFEPVFGGAGPNGVNVIRHGVRSSSGDFIAPPGGTIAHRLAVGSAERPSISPSANLFELRQTPPVFGLARLAAVPQAEILALQDPDDDNGDGVRGVAHELPDGRWGRFGWRADVPTLREFVRDALSAELGLTVPAQSGLTYGVESDADPVADPEASPELIDELTFYLSSLAPPPRAAVDAAAASEGRSIFDEIGCATCHVPALPAADGSEVRAFTNLLLHDVQAAEFVGVPSFSASGREFRTPPLWGLRATAPYWHDGHAETIEAAIAAHDGEAQAARDRYQQLDEDGRGALLTFLESL